MLVFYLGLIIFFSFLLIKATEILVESFKKIARSTRMGKFALTSFIMALATSLPELFVGLVAALEGEPNLSLGNVLGSNIANLSLVIGGTALVGGSIKVVGGFLKKDVFYTFLAGSLPLLFLMDGVLSRVDGLILLVVYFWYNLTVLQEREQKELKNGEDWKTTLLKRFDKKIPEREAGWIFAGIVLLIFSAEMIVKVAQKMAQMFKLPLLLIGLFLVSAGTTLPEFAFGLKAIKKREVAMVFGNLLGSVVANSTLILGLVAMIAPIKIEYINEYLVATIAFVIIYALFWNFVRTKKRLDRWEGGILLLVYLAFAAVEFLR